VVVGICEADIPDLKETIKNTEKCELEKAISEIFSIPGF
jgi:hypothetical protein